MDGNGRWAENKGRPRLFGHQAGARWATNGGDDVRFLEPHALLEQLVEMGCVGVWMPGKAERPGGLIVRQDEHHIGLSPIGIFG